MPDRTRDPRPVALDDAYRKRVDRALDEVLQRTLDRESDEPAPSLDLAAPHRLILFSDQHKGARNKADDFRRCERAYNAALAYYFEMGYTLVTLGDVEELWEERPRSVLKAYAHTFELEARFHRQGRYIRFWGNHDDAWSFEDMVDRHLAPLFGADRLNVREGLRIRVVDGARELGHFFLLHGHQGDRTSSQFAWLSRLFVRFVWRPLQRLTGISLNTPAKDWALRQKLNIAMYEWAAGRDGLVLLAGHTHHPVFKSKSHAAQIREALTRVEAQRLEAPEDGLLRQRAGELQADLEWVLAQEQTAGDGPASPLSKPCYFNTGCCCFVDGDVTGLEITDGTIRLVRWPDDADRPRPQILAEASLQEVFAAC